MSNHKIIICGNPRSGTQMLVKVVNLHPEIAITGEYAPPMLTDTFSLIRNVGRHLERASSRASLRAGWHHETLARWQEEKPNILLEGWKSVSTESVARKAGRCSVIGNKTPGAEFYFDEFDWLFSSRVKYIYCLREGAKVLRSLKNMPWNRTSFRKNLERYKRSIQVAEAFQRKSPDRILFCQVDLIAEGDGGLETTGQNVFQFLGQEMTSDMSERLRSLKPAQPLTSPKLGLDTVKELTKREIKKLASDTEYVRICRSYGYGE